MTAPCNCQHRSGAFEFRQGEFTRLLVGLERITHDWHTAYHLYKCKSCGTLWIIDDMAGGTIAVKAESETEIEHFDERPYRRELAKQDARGVHFLAIQSDPNSESFAGFWLLQELNLG